MERYKIPKKAICRICGYYRELGDLEASGDDTVLSRELGEHTRCSASQVRQDLTFFGSFGVMGSGYGVSALRVEVGRILGADRARAAVLIGAGHMGAHLARSSVFSDCGVSLAAVFDASDELIGADLGGITVRDAASLAGYLRGTDIAIAVLCLPAGSAQSAADTLCAGGVKAIWNISGGSVSLPAGVILEETNLADSFLALGYQISARRKAQEEKREPALTEIYPLRDRSACREERLAMAGFK